MKIMRYLMVLCTIFSIYSCSSDDTDTTSITPSITISDIGRHEAVVNGIIPIGDNTEIEECGIYWSSANEKPTDMNNRVIAEQKNGKFQVKLTKLAGGTTYYIRGYAKNRTVSDISETVQFMTPKGVAEISMYVIGMIPYNTCNINTLDIGGGEVLERGYCYCEKTEENEYFMPSIENSPKKILTGGVTNSFNFTTGEAGKRYYARLYIITTEGIGYSNRVEYFISVWG